MSKVICSYVKRKLTTFLKRKMSGVRNRNIEAEKLIVTNQYKCNVTDEILHINQDTYYNSNLIVNFQFYQHKKLKKNDIHFWNLEFTG